MIRNFVRTCVVAAAIIGMLALVFDSAATAEEQKNPKSGRITFLSGSIKIDNNNSYVITWKTTNPTEETVWGWAKLHGINDNNFYSCRGDWNNPATNTCSMNVGKNVATGVSFRFTRAGATVISETAVIPLSRTRK